jgi:hypothetical protein
MIDDFKFLSSLHEVVARGFSTPSAAVGGSLCAHPSGQISLRHAKREERESTQLEMCECESAVGAKEMVRIGQTGGVTPVVGG